MFSTADHVAILGIPRRSETGVVQEVMRAATLAQPDTQRRLQDLNRQGYDLYCTVNTVKPGARSRTKTDIADVRRLQLDLDDNGREGLRKLRADVDAGRVPSPAVVMQSSSDRFQVLWHTVPGAWTAAAAEATMARLANAYGGDRVVTDVARVMRLPGFANHKEGREGWVVTWARYDGPRTMQADFRGLPQPEQASITQIIELLTQRRNCEAASKRQRVRMDGSRPPMVRTLRARSVRSPSARTASTARRRARFSPSRSAIRASRSASAARRTATPVRRTASGEPSASAGPGIGRGMTAAGTPPSVTRRSPRAGSRSTARA
jgi:hypothetical protein